MNEKNEEFQEDFDYFEKKFIKYDMNHLFAFALARVLRVSDRKNPRSSALASVIEDKLIGLIEVDNDKT